MYVRSRWEPVARAMEGFAHEGGLMLTCAMQAPHGEPSGALVLLHGRGTDEHDIYPLLEMIDPARRLLGIAPRAPLESEPEGRSFWFERDEAGRPRREAFVDAVAGVGRWLDRTAEVTGVPLSSTVIGGFAEGAVLALALATAPGRPRPAGVILISGRLPDVEDFELHLDNVRDLPVALGYGLDDPVVPAAEAQALQRVLEASGAVVTARASRTGHFVHLPFVRELPRWIYRVVADIRYAEATEGTGRFSLGTSVIRPRLLA